MKFKNDLQKAQLMWKHSENNSIDLATAVVAFNTHAPLIKSKTIEELIILVDEHLAL